MKDQKTIVVIILCLIFTALLVRNIRSDLPLIFQKVLHGHDESSNSVVAANVTRNFFPPMVRVNPLNEQQGNWMEGPYWQHIPPLFAYIPYVFFKLDGQISIEVKRLSYAFVTLSTGLLFIFCIYKFRKSLLTAAAATLSAIFWINTPFTHELITGYAFGVSDIVLAFYVACGFGAILWYLFGEKEERLVYPYWELAVIGLLVALPLMAKDLLGAIPAAVFFGLLLYDHRQINKKLLAAGASFIGLLLFYYLGLYFASPETFKNEVLVSFLHFKQLEGWGRPWHFYLTNYLPQRYLFDWAWVYFAGLFFGAAVSIKHELPRKERILLWLSGGWFLWNLLAISAVTSKVPNFIFQSYLFSLFFIVYAVIIVAKKFFNLDQPVNLMTKKVLTVVLLLSFLAAGYEAIGFARQFKMQRAQAYNYQNEHEQFYRVAEELRKIGLNTNDLVIVRVSDNDCWFRYYPLFLTGTETKTLLELAFGFDANAVRQKYSRMFFVENKLDPDFNENRRIELENYSLLEYDLGRMNTGQIQSLIDSFVNFYKQDIQADIQRIKKDKTSCQWLVPDAILNAP